MGAETQVKVGRTSEGFLVRIEGRGTMRESSAVHRFAVESLDREPSSLAVDLSGCDYLDSTFLGCLIDLHKRYGTGPSPRFELVAPSRECLGVLSTIGLVQFFQISCNCPQCVGNLLPVDTEPMPMDELGPYILECHRRLAEVSGPSQRAFGAVAEQLARELGAGND